MQKTKKWVSVKYKTTVSFSQWNKKPKITESCLFFRSTGFLMGNSNKIWPYIFQLIKMKPSICTHTFCSEEFQLSYHFIATLPGSVERHKKAQLSMAEIEFPGLWDNQHYMRKSPSGLIGWLDEAGELQQVSSSLHCPPGWGCRPLCWATGVVSPPFHPSANHRF